MTHSTRSRSTAPSAARCAVYCRVSSAEQQDNSSLSTQEQSCRRYAAGRGWSVVAVYADVHTGAELFERPQLTLLREAMRRGEFDVLLVHALDRLSRKQTHQGLILSEAEHAGVRWDSVTEDVDDSPQGQILRAVIGGMAEMERLKILERTMRGKRARVDSGRLLGTAILYGYRWRDTTKSSYGIDPDSGPIVQQIFAEALSGKTIRNIARTLSDKGIPTPKGGPLWSSSTIHTILKQRAYVGEGVAWKYGTERTDEGRKRCIVRPSSEWAKLPDGTIPPLIPTDVFDAVQSRLVWNRDQAIRNNHNPESALLRGGYARCGYCGTTLNVTSKKGGVFYRHGTRSLDQYGCPASSIKVERLDSEVWGRVEALLLEPQLIETQLERFRDEDPTTSDLSAVDRQIQIVMRKQENLTKRLALIEDEDVAAIVTTELTGLAESKRLLVADRESLVSRRREWGEARKRVDDLKAWCKRVAANLNDFSYERKLEALAALGVEVRLFHPTHTPRFEINASIPFEDDIVFIGSRACAGSVWSRAARPAGPA